MHGALVHAWTPEEPAREGTPGETHIHPAYGLPIWGAMGCFSLGVVKSGQALWQCQAVGSMLLEVYSQNSAGQRREQPGLDLQLAPLSAGDYFRCLQKSIPASFSLPLSLPLSLSLALYLLLCFFLLNGNKTWFFSPRC